MLSTTPPPYASTSLSQTQQPHSDYLFSAFVASQDHHSCESRYGDYNQAKRQGRESKVTHEVQPPRRRNGLSASLFTSELVSRALRLIVIKDGLFSAHSCFDVRDLKNNMFKFSRVG